MQLGIHDAKGPAPSQRGPREAAIAAGLPTAGHTPPATPGRCILVSARVEVRVETNSVSRPGQVLHEHSLP